MNDKETEKILIITLGRRWSCIILILLVEERFAFFNIFKGSRRSHRWRQWLGILVVSSFAAIENGAKHKNLSSKEIDQKCKAEQGSNTD
jgi:hypothetical protein